jgi:hypothetical protein
VWGTCTAAPYAILGCMLGCVRQLPWASPVFRLLTAPPCYHSIHPPPGPTNTCATLSPVKPQHRPPLWCAVVWVALVGGALQQVGVVAQLAQHINPRQRLAPPHQDVRHIPAGQVGPGGGGQGEGGGGQVNDQSAGEWRGAVGRGRRKNRVPGVARKV